MSNSKASMKRKSLLVDLLSSHVPLKRIRTSPGPVSSSVVNEILGPCPICCDSGNETRVPLLKTNPSDEKILMEIFSDENDVNDLLWNCVTCSKTLRELGELKLQKDNIENRIEQITFCIRTVVRNKKAKNKRTPEVEDIKPIIKLEGNVSSFKPTSDASISNEEIVPGDIKSKEVVPFTNFTIICKELEWTDIESDGDEGLSETAVHNELEMDNDNVSFSKKPNNEIVRIITEEIEETSATSSKLAILNEKELSNNSQNQSSKKGKPPTSCGNCGKTFSSNYHVRRHVQNKVCTKNKRPKQLFGASEKSDVSINVLQFTHKASIKQGDYETVQQNELYSNQDKSYDEVKVELCEDIPDVEFNNCHELEDDHEEENTEKFVQEEETIPAENIDTTKRAQRASKARASELIHSLLQEKSKKEENDDSEPEGTTDSELEYSEEFDEKYSDFEEEEESIGEQIKEQESCLDVIRDIPRVSTTKSHSASSKRIRKQNRQGEVKQIKKKSANIKETEPDDEINNKCDNCGQEIIGTKAYQRHLRSNTHNLAILCKLANNDFGYKCFLEQCGKTYNLIGDMVKHFRTHPDKSECKPCKTTFKEKRHLVRHLLTEAHAESMGPDFLLRFGKLKKFSCNSCEKSFANLYHLQNHHQTVHKLSYLCEICSKIFPFESMLKKHQLLHQEKPPPRVPIVPKERVRSAPPIEKSIICKLCGKTFIRSSGLYIHRKTFHKGYRYKCPDCPKEYAKYNGLRYHKLTTHGTQEEREKIYKRTNATYSCRICGKSLVGKVNLHAHIELVHFPLRENCPAGCELPEKFKNDDEWKEHLENCKSAKLGEPAKCFFCQAIFPNYFLQLHHQIQSHKTHSCKYCNRVFTKPIVKTRHLYEHKESREFLCPKCGKSFRAMYNLTLHMKIVCNDDENAKKELAEKRKQQYLDFRNKSNKYKCSKCPKRFVDEDKLKKHLEKAHVDVDDDEEEEEIDGE